MRARSRISIIGIILSIVTALLAAMASTGSTVRIPLVLTIFFSGFAGGASLAVLISGLRYRKKEEED